MKKMKVKVFPIAKKDIYNVFEENNIFINDYCRDFIEHEEFKLSESEDIKNIIILSLEEMGFTEPPTLPEIISKASDLGFRLCEPSIGVYLRLHYKEQTNSTNSVLSGAKKISRQCSTNSLSAI